MEEKIVLFNDPYRGYGCFCLEYNTDFMYMANRFTSLKQYMIYQKALLFRDLEKLQVILDTKRSTDLDVLEENLQFVDEEIWAQVKEHILFRGMVAKFLQYRDIKNELLETKDAMIAYAVLDTHLGIGLERKDERAMNPLLWSGENYLGKLLMKTRDYIIAYEHANPDTYKVEEYYKDYPHMQLWTLPFHQLYDYAGLKDALDCYLNGLPKKYRKLDILSSSPSEIENDIRSPWHGSCPIEGFWNFKQEFYELVMHNMVDLFPKQKTNRIGIKEFAKYYLKAFENYTEYQRAIKENFLEDMLMLHFEFEYGRKIQKCLPNHRIMDHFEALELIHDVDALTSAILFKYYRSMKKKDLKDDIPWFKSSLLQLNHLLNQ